MRTTTLLSSLAAVVPAVLACDGCYGPSNHVEHVRNVKRMQPGAPLATYGPTRALEWGQVNFLHTTDTHGWLEGHLKEGNYGADWGDFVSFAKHMKDKAASMGVDLLLVDSGDLHDGNGLSDATTPDGTVSMPIFEKLNYDLLTIGNHELYLADVSLQSFQQIAKFYGDKYLTSNVQIVDPATGQWTYIGATHKYFTTANGLRIMAFGVLYDFTGNVQNLTKVIPAKTMVTMDWFKQAIQPSEPVDLFLVLGHNPTRPGVAGSTFGTVYNAIRAANPKTPIQFFGGHTHIRDFAAIDDRTTSLESGRYCETLGWLSMSGFSQCNSAWKGAVNPGPKGTPNPKRGALNGTATSPFLYSRRYMDWNRLTFEFHAVGASTGAAYDTPEGLSTTSLVSQYRQSLNLSDVYGCVPHNYCMTCAPFTDENNIFPLLTKALSTVVVNSARTNKARYIIANTGSIRFDMYKGPFTFDDNFIISPFRDIFLYVPDVPYSVASTILGKLNGASTGFKREDLGSMPVTRDICTDPVAAPLHEIKLRRGEKVGITRRQAIPLTPGYTTTDDFGSDGDDTAHSSIPFYNIPNYFQGAAGFPTDGSNPETVDIVFVDFIQSNILNLLGSGYSAANVTYYVSPTFSTQEYLPAFVKSSPIFQSGLPTCV